jgi:DNA mismatch repair ATPase MutS
LKNLSKKLGYLVIDKSAIGDLGAAIIEYLNVILLFDLKAYIRSIVILEEHLEEIREVFEIVAELDMMISFASYIDETENLTIPKFVSEKEISFENIYHPVVDNAVSNSLDELNKSALITGSNMAGKTTFIKTIGVNLILAQTIFLCHASSITTFRFFIKTSIKREDNIENSKSYFFAEIEAIKSFIQLAKKSENYLFLIDEIFRGTNTIERLASATAVLEYLNRSNRALVTTHDIELHHLLKNKFEVYHFSEQVSDGKFYFDYKIANGSASKGNAIKLLEIMEYPIDVTDKAIEIAEQLKEKNPLNEGLVKI